MTLIKNILSITLIAFFLVLLTLFSYIGCFFMSRINIIRLLSYGSLIVRKIIFFINNIKIEYRGLENIPKEPCIFASKHQSLIETSFFFNIFKMQTVYAFKKEINDVPLWGRISKKFGGVPIDRQKGSKIIDNFITKVKHYLNNNYSIVIFPEGTRVGINEKRKFKKGISKIYLETSSPIVPVALNTGIVFPKKSKKLYSKTIIIEFLPQMPKNLSENDFLEQLENKINQKSTELVEESNHQ